MNNISEQILEAIDILTNERMSQLQYDKTVQAKIYKIVNLDTGEYKVKYNGNIFSVYSNDLGKTYKVDTDVYITVPEGDFSNKKMITSTVADQSLSQEQLTQLQNSVFEASPDFNDLYDKPYDPSLVHEIIAGLHEFEQEDLDQPSYQDIINKYNIIAGGGPGEPNSYTYIYRGPDEIGSSDYNGLFQQYANNYEHIKIQGSFLTQFHCTPTKGNYGLQVEFYTKDGDTISYRLDLSSFNGSPYSFSTYSPQSVIIQAQKGYLLGLKSIQLFEENFSPDRFIENGQVTDKENLRYPNIFVKDIKIQFVEVKDLSDSSYYLTISTPRGISFTNNIFSLDLVGRLLYQGNDLINSNCECYWFERDVHVTIGSELYDKDGGFGWKAIKGQDNQLTINIGQVAHQQEYKLVVIYNESVKVTSEVTLYNKHTDNTHSFSLKQETEENKAMVFIDSEEKLVGDWYVAYPDGSYLPIDAKVPSIDISDYLQYSTATFYCAVYTEDEEYLGTLTHTIVNAESQEDLVVTYSGEDTFRYDANGTAAIDDIEEDSSSKDHILQPILAWREGVAAAYNITWSIDGHELSTSKDQAYTPNNSMMTDMWVDNSNILHYYIRKKYNISCQNNTLTININTISGDTYSFDKEILFLKDGDQGTNGTSYIAVIRPCDNAGTKLSGLHPLTYNLAWTGTHYVHCYVYKDGERIDRDTTGNFDISYRWYGRNVLVNDKESITAKTEGEGLNQVQIKGVPRITNNSSSSDLEFYVKAQIDIVDRGHDNNKITLYALYPFDVAVGGFDYTKANIDDIPSYIKYNSSGLVPTFSNKEINFYYDNEPHNDMIDSLNPKLLDVKQSTDGTWKLEVAQSFIFEDAKVNGDSNIGVLSMRDPTSNARRLIHPIIMYLDTYGNEAINGWDGTTLDINEEDGHIFAPMIGAGEKDEANRFTGIVMGKDNGQDLVGLYGYKEGVNTFGLLENGTAFFGAESGGGQIRIDGRSAVIYGGNVQLNSSSGKPRASKNGMYLVLADKSANTLEETELSTTKAIGIGLTSDEREENFYVTYAGKLKATEADIQGTIYANEGFIGGTGRQGGWEIKSGRLFSGSSSNYVALDSTKEGDEGYVPYAFWAGRTTGGSAVTKGDDGKINDITTPAPFVVTKDGFLYATNAKVKGNIEADSGNIGDWLIEKRKIYSTSGTLTIGMSASGNASFWVGKNLDEDSESASDDNAIGAGTDSAYFLVTRSGKLYCKSAEVNGTIKATRIDSENGNIAGWEFRNNGFYNNTTGTSIRPTSISYGSNFSVSQSGEIKANKGTIGNWTINDRSGAITNNVTTLTGDGEIETQAINIYCEEDGFNLNLGTLGLVKGFASTTQQVTNNIGITSASTDRSIILDSKNNVAIKAYERGPYDDPYTDKQYYNYDGAIYLHAKEIHFQGSYSRTGINVNGDPNNCPIKIYIGEYRDENEITNLFANKKEFKELENKVKALEDKVNS